MLQAGFSGRLLLFFYRINDGCISFPSHLFAPSWLAGLSHVPMVLPELLGGQFLAEQLIATEMEFGSNGRDSVAFLPCCYSVDWRKKVKACPFDL